MHASRVTLIEGFREVSLARVGAGLHLREARPAGWCRADRHHPVVSFLSPSALLCARSHAWSMNRPQSSLLRILGLSFGLAVTVGNTIGGGILRTPGDIASSCPTPWLFVGIWVVGGLYASARRERALGARDDASAQRRTVRVCASRVRRLRGLSRRMARLDLDLRVDRRDRDRDR